MATSASPAKKGKWVGPSRYDDFVNGKLTVEDLDQEELLRGQLRDKNGSFQGRPPLMIPRSFHQKLTQELLTRAEGTIRENFDEAIATFVEIMKNPRVRPQDRLYAAQYVWERMAGKIPEKQVIEASVKKWEEVAEAVFVEIIDDTMEAELVEPADVPARAITAGDAAPSAYGVTFDDDDEPVATPRRPRRPTRKAS